LLRFPVLLLILVNGALASLSLGVMSARFRAHSSVREFDHANPVFCDADHVEAELLKDQRCWISIHFTISSELSGANRCLELCRPFATTSP